MTIIITEKMLQGKCLLHGIVFVAWKQYCGMFTNAMNANTLDN